METKPVVDSRADRRYCIARVGTWLTQACGYRAKFVSVIDGAVLCGTHANRWKRAGHTVNPIRSSAEPTQERK